MSQKVPEFRSKKYREGGRGLSCVLHPGRPVHSGAHLPHAAIGFPGGKGYKCSDLLLGDVCMECHHELDQGDWRNDHQIRMKIFALTVERRIHQGILVVPGEKHEWDGIY